MKLLKKDELKNEFLELKQKQNLSDDEIISYLMYKLESEYLITEFNGIYVYMGTYKLVHESTDAWYPVSEVLVDENDQSAEYKSFKELDTGLKRDVKIGEEMNQFEKDSIIIVIPNVRNFEDDFTFEEDFKKLRKLYLRELCTKNEETAVSAVTSVQWINEIFSIENYLKENNISPVFYQAFYDAALCNKKPSSGSVAL